MLSAMLNRGSFKLKKEIDIAFSLFCLVVVLFFTSCSTSVVSSENKQKGKLQATHTLVVSGEKNILLDETVAPESPYLQMYYDSSGSRILTSLNTYNHSIYFFDYDKGRFMNKVSYSKEGPDAILGIGGYYIKNRDSIYIYNRPLVEVALTDHLGVVKERISLRKKEQDWFLFYPQYFFNTVCPMLEVNNHLILTGMCSFSIEDTIIDKFHFTASIHLDSKQLEFLHTYPNALYGNNANWEDPLFMQVYPTVSPQGELIHSFPTSHDIYISSWDSNVSKLVYGGGNEVRTISSIDYSPTAKTPKELVYTHYLKQDLYAAILYDPWREVYYRFVQQGIKDATKYTKLEEKNIVVVLMDKEFLYLGEKLLGTGEKWNWKNSFVTEEGLNIEYIDSSDIEDSYMRFKILTPKELTH